MPKHGRLMLVPKLRPGEGKEMEVIHRTVPQADGSSTQEFSIDMSYAPVPDRRYVADRGAILFEGDAVKMVLGQKQILGARLRSAVVVFLSSHATLNFLKSCKEFLPPLQEYVAQHAIPDSVIDISEEPEVMTFVTANIILAGYSGREACLDFYDSSPFAMAILKKGGKMALDPILRVDLGTGLLLALIGIMEDLKLKLPSF